MEPAVPGISSLHAVTVTQHVEAVGAIEIAAMTLVVLECTQNDLWVNLIVGDMAIVWVNFKLRQPSVDQCLVCNFSVLCRDSMTPLRWKN